MPEFTLHTQLRPGDCLRVTDPLRGLCEADLHKTYLYKTYCIDTIKVNTAKRKILCRDVLNPCDTVRLPYKRVVRALLNGHLAYLGPNPAAHPLPVGLPLLYPSPMSAPTHVLSFPGIVTKGTSFKLTGRLQPFTLKHKDASFHVASIRQEGGVSLALCRNFNDPSDTMELLVSVLKNALDTQTVQYLGGSQTLSSIPDTGLTLEQKLAYSDRKFVFTDTTGRLLAVIGLLVDAKGKQVVYTQVERVSFKRSHQGSTRTQELLDAYIDKFEQGQYTPYNMTSVNPHVLDWVDELNSMGEDKPVASAQLELESSLPPSTHKPFRGMTQVVVIPKPEQPLYLEDVPESQVLFTADNGVLVGMIIQCGSEGWQHWLGGADGRFNDIASETRLECVREVLAIGYTIHTNVLA